MTTPQDEIVRRVLAEAVADVHPGDASAQRALNSGKKAVRRRRIALTAAASTVMALAVTSFLSSGSWFEKEAVLDAAPGHSRTAAPASPATKDEAWNWARKLPEGKQTSLPFIVDGVLHVAEQRYALPGTDAGVVGATTDGWLVLVEYDSRDSGGGFASRYVVVTPSGRLERLPQSAFQAQGAVISPSGDRVGYGSAVVEVATKRAIATIPASATLLTAWSSKGIVFSNSDGDSFLWRVGEKPMSLAARLEVVSASGRSIERHSSAECSRVLDVGADGSLRPIWRGCKREVPTLLSPDGELAVAADWTVVLLSDGRRRAFAKAPPTEIMHSVAWESNRSFVFPVYERTTTGRGAEATRSALLVRCDTDSLTCERASSEMEVPTSDELLAR